MGKLGKPSFTRGFAQVPNIFIENLSLLIPAEIALGLLLFRRGGNMFAQGGVDVEISDDTWIRWTGLKPRTKEFALAGLREKCLSVEGQGNKAKIFFEPQRWREFVKLESQRRGEVETKVRAKPVKAKPGMDVHPDCKERGCQMLCGEGAKPAPCLVPVPAAAVAAAKPLPPPVDYANPFQPVGADPTARVPKPATKPIEREMMSQPSKGRNASAWSQTIAAVANIFPAAGADFVLRLAARARGVRPKITDDELASAVRACWHAKKSVQKTEGLFLTSVPAFLESHSSMSIVPTRKQYKCSACLDTGIQTFGAPIDSEQDFIQKPCASCRPGALGSTA